MPRDSRDLLNELYHQAKLPSKSSAPWIWFFDFDGTLADLAPHPDAVHLAPGLADDLVRLIEVPHQTVAIVSGRPLPDLVRHLPPHQGLWISGDHGAEVKGPNGFFWRHPYQGAIQDHVQTLAADLTDRLNNLIGVWIELKPTSLSIHYRQAPESSITRLNQIVETFAWTDEWTIKSAHRCYEVRAVKGPSKSDAVRVIRNAIDPMGVSLCLAWGDDVTDEDMFVALPNGITVKIGSLGTATHARFQVDSTTAVRELIHQMADYWTH